MSNILIVLVGPTAVGKTKVVVKLGQQLGCEVISADSRQFYHEMEIGTARPSIEELGKVPHHFLGHISIGQEYTAGMFEQEVIALLEHLFVERDHVILTGGSGLYVQAVCEGIDDIPSANPELRAGLADMPLPKLQEELRKCDPEYYETVDLNNSRRLIRALEVCMTTGKPFSSFHSTEAKQRPFSILKIGLELDRDQLYQRINERVDRMMEAGLLNEAMSLQQYRHMQSLHAVGYTELFEHLDGKLALEEALELIKRNTRRYAKRQMTWWRKDEGVRWFAPEDIESMLEYIQRATS